MQIVLISFLHRVLRTIYRLWQVEGCIFDLWSLSGLRQWQFSIGSSSLFLQGSLFICLQCQVQLNTPRGKDFGLPPCCDTFSVIFCFLVYAFYVIPLRECVGVPVEWFGPVYWRKMFLSATNFLLHLNYYFVLRKGKNMSLLREELKFGTSSVVAYSWWPSVLLMGSCTTKQGLKLNSGNILQNSTASHLLFRVCIPSVPPPCKGLQISLWNQSRNLQHIFVPDANYSRILKAITQTPEDPEGGLYMVSICDTEGRGIMELNLLPGQTRTP